MAVSMVGLSVANYVLALVLVWVFAVQLAVLPGDRLRADRRRDPSTTCASLVLPAIAIGFPLFCFYTRFLRADIVEQMQGQDYVTTARAKGIGPWRVLTRHAFRNSLVRPADDRRPEPRHAHRRDGDHRADLRPARASASELLQAISNRNIPVIEGIVLVFAVVVVMANLDHGPAVRRPRPAGAPWQHLTTTAPLELAGAAAEPAAAWRRT